MGTARPAAPDQSPARALEDYDLPGCATPRSDRRSMATPSDRRAPFRPDQVVDGVDPLPNENAQARQHRDGAARPRLQHETGNEHSGRWRTNGRDPSIKSAFRLSGRAYRPQHSRFYTAWVIFRLQAASQPSPFTRRQRTCSDCIDMSVSCQPRSFGNAHYSIGFRKLLEISI